MAFGRPLAILFYGDNLFLILFIFPPACAPHWRDSNNPWKMERAVWWYYGIGKISLENSHTEGHCFIAVEHELKKKPTPYHVP